MGHIAGKDIYRQLGRKIDQLTLRTPWNEDLHNILKALYSEEEATVVTRMPYGMSRLSRISKTTKTSETKLAPILETLCEKGLVVDMFIKGEQHYSPSPLAIGIFEFTMMRTGDNLDSSGWAALFHRYMQGSEVFYAANCEHGEQTSLMRTLPYLQAIKRRPHVEVLDYEKAESIVDQASAFSIGLCSCRHEKYHVGEKRCDTPLDTCTAFGYAAEYLIRRKLARPAEKREILDQLERSRELGLVLNADNVQRNVTYICHCCGCCCNVLLGINSFGYSNIVVTSTWIAEIDAGLCNGCGKCARACPVNAIEMLPLETPAGKKKKTAKVDTDICLGCGVCSMPCKTEAIGLVKREQRVLHPETTFQRVILQSLDRGTLQNQIFDDPSRLTHGFMRNVVGAFLKLPPVKKSLMSDTLRSTFLKTLEAGIKLKGKGWALKV